MRCVFCDIVAGSAPAVVQYRWRDAVAITPLNPVVEGHVIVIPHAHVRDAFIDPLITGYTMARAADYLQITRTHPANLITSIGREATQTVFHLHVHVVPRRAGDGLSLPWAQGAAG